MRQPNMKPRPMKPHKWTMQLRLKSILPMMSSPSAAVVVDARSVEKQVNDFRKSSLAPVLDRAARSKSGFALGELPSTVNRRFSACEWSHPTTSASTDV